MYCILCFNYSKNNYNAFLHKDICLSASGIGMVLVMNLTVILFEVSWGLLHTVGLVDPIWILGTSN